jgi:hypothetical protein
VSIITTTELSDLCGYEFDPSDEARATAVIALLETAATGVVGTLDEDNPHPLVVAAITSAALRQMQNRSGVTGETIGGFTAQYPSAGRLFTGEELVMLRSARGTRVGTIRLRTHGSTETTTEGA